MSGPGMDHVTVPVTGGDLFVARWGSGPPVLAVHGITGSHAAWPWVADRLAGGLLNQTEPFLSDNSVTKHLPTIPGARHEVVEGTNHYTLVMGVGAAAVADRILEAVRGD